eukprot:2362345-Rhodomonas_salina.1
MTRTRRCSVGCRVSLCDRKDRRMQRLSVPVFVLFVLDRSWQGMLLKAVAVVVVIAGMPSERRGGGGGCAMMM